MTAGLIMVAYDFPPKNSSGAARPYRFFSALPRMGIEPHVVTASVQSSDSPFVSYVRDRARSEPRSQCQWQLERFIRKLALPGELGLLWSRDVARFALNLDGIGQAAVFSTFPPLGTHLAAYWLKRRAGTPWIADFRDPLPGMELPGGRRSLFSRIEAFIARHADAVILNTDSAAQLWVNRYPAYRAKFHVIWNGFDPGQTLSAAQTPLRSVRTIAHVGELYAGRDPGPILDALVDLVESNRLEQDDFQLTLAGPVNDERVSKSSSLARLKELNVLDYRPNQIAQDEARRINMESDGLLLLQPQSSVQVPAKLFDYIRIGRPVLAYVQPDSPSELILKKSGIPSRFIYPGENLESIKEKILGFLQLSNRSSRSSQWFDETFSSHSQVIELAEVVRSVKGAL